MTWSSDEPSPPAPLLMEEYPNAALITRPHAGGRPSGEVDLSAMLDLLTGGQTSDETFGAASGMRSYALLDAGRIWGLPERLEASGHAFRCLFRDVAEFGNVAPWLVELAPDSRLLRQLLTPGDGPAALWRHQAAVFLRSRDEPDALHAHLSRLVKVRSDAGPALFLRFWDPMVAHHYFGRIADWDERIGAFFQSRHARIDEIIVPLQAAGTTRRFVLTAAPTTTSPPFILTERDRSALADAHWPQFRIELADWLLRADPVRFRGFRAKGRLAIAAHAIREGRNLGLVYKEEYAYFLYMMFYLGGWFHRSPVFADVARHLTAPDDNRYARLRRDFPKDYSALYDAYGDPMTVLREFRDRLKRLLAERGGWEEISAEDAQSVVAAAERPFQYNPAALHANRALALSQAEKIGLRSARDQNIFHAFWLILGAWFYYDPLFPWTAAKMNDQPNPSKGLVAMARYGLRRIDRSLNLHERISHA